MKNLNSVLAGKRVRIMGLDAGLTEEVSEIFREVGATSTGQIDADLVVAGGGAHGGDAATPHLVIGSLEEIGQQPRFAERADFLIGPPLRSDEVLLRAYRLLTGARRAAAGATPAVLAVDDDATTTAIVRAVVTRNGMTCHVAANGKQALESARSLNPSVIILDVNMPFIDGFEVLSTLRKDPETATIPIIMLTSVQQESDIVRGFGLGADDYVVKPFNPMELLARIRRLVPK